MIKHCECGCGQPAPIAQKHSPKRGHVKGEPLRFLPGHNMPAVPFWDRVAKGAALECWPWTGHTNEGGYGMVRWGRRSTGAHRVAYELTTGVAPGGLCVLHTCDNPPCCNPTHLWLGDRADNNADKAAKGRARGGSCPLEDHARGKGHGMARLTESQVVAIRRRWAEGESQSALGRHYGVHVSTVHLIVHRKKWGHLS